MEVQMNGRRRNERVAQTNLVVVELRAYVSERYIDISIDWSELRVSI